jgi:hypothetical protein
LRFSSSVDSTILPGVFAEIITTRHGDWKGRVVRTGSFWSMGKLRVRTFPARR